MLHTPSPPKSAARGQEPCGGCVNDGDIVGEGHQEDGVRCWPDVRRESDVADPPGQGARRSAWHLQGGVAGEATIARLKPANIVHIGLALFIARVRQTTALQRRFYFLTLEGAACRRARHRRCGRNKIALCSAEYD